ncbi:MAG: aldo/keto reductase [Janthinobacterium lividum]
MQTIELPGSGRRTTRLGFGCSSIMGGMGRKQSLHTLEWAFDAGIRHFDVAPMYGFGAAEACLGEFLRRHAGDVTVTTKFGIPPAKNTGFMNMARTLARPLIKAVPALKARAQRAASSVAATPAQRDLSAAAAERSLKNSLRQLCVDRVDVFLLHDATLDEVRNAELLNFLEKAKQDGSVGCFGIGTDRKHAADIVKEAPQFAGVVQQEWSVFDPVPTGEAFHIHHRSLAHNRTRLQMFFESRQDVAAQWSLAVDADLKQPEVLTELMMRAALLNNQGGIVLFSSKDRAHIRANALLSEPSPADAKADLLYRLVQRETDNIPQRNTA